MAGDTANKKKTIKKKAPPAAWSPGQSGNPNGRPKLTEADREALEMFKGALPKVVDKLVDTAINSTNEELAFKAQTYITDRVLGKAKQSVDMDVDAKMQILITGAVKDWGV
jgi:hypothetical protein